VEGEVQAKREEEVKDTNAIRLTLLILAVSTLIAATVLTATDNDSAVAWGAFSTIVGALVGQYLPTPKQGA
jgi:hypothetical protein